MSDHLDTLSWYCHQAENLAFTRWHSLEFSEYVDRDDLVVDSAESLANSGNYAPYSSFLLKRFLREALDIGIPFKNFVDVGCGKGLPCIFAKRYFGFDQVYGIDFCAPLIDIAKQNLTKTSYTNVSFLVADATSWKIPDGNTVVFLFNPFNEIILEKFLKSNLEHFARYSSLIVYGMDKHRSTISRLGFETIFRSFRHEHSIFKYSGPPSH